MMFLWKFEFFCILLFMLFKRTLSVHEAHKAISGITNIDNAIIISVVVA